MADDNTPTPASMTPARLWASVVVIVVLIGAAVALVLFSNPDQAPATATILAIIVAALPGAVAAIFAERASRDMRNGVVAEKAFQGAAAAIDAKQVMTRTGPVVTAELAALQRLLEANTTATQINTNALHAQGDHEGESAA